MKITYDIAYPRKLTWQYPLNDYREIVGKLGKAEVEFTFKYISVLHLLGVNSAPPVVPVALVWLDGHGWGKVSLQLLAELIILVKDLSRPKASGN